MFYLQGKFAERGKYEKIKRNPQKTRTDTMPTGGKSRGQSYYNMPLGKRDKTSLVCPFNETH